MTAMTLPRRQDRIVVMGVVNVTPDSFSDGGRYLAVDDAVAHAEAMWAAGADLIDVGGESTRPGAERVPTDEEIRRVLPVIKILAERGIALSVDTYRAAVADAALAAGAGVVNDVSGGLGDADMARVVRDADCPWILMHWRGPSRVMGELAHYQDVVADVRRELGHRVESALALGVARDQIAIDPGLGFAKTASHNWQLLAHLDVLIDLQLPVLLGASRKSFLGSLLAGPDGQQRGVDDREHATVALTAYAALAGAWGVRVHEVRPNIDAALTVAALRKASSLSLTSSDPLFPARDRKAPQESVSSGEQLINSGQLGVDGRESDPRG
jgi:dihydropteroate synthase